MLVLESAAGIAGVVAVVVIACVLAIANSGFAAVVAAAADAQAIANLGFVAVVAAAADAQAIVNLGFVAVEYRSVMTMSDEVTGSGFLEPRVGPSIATLVPA